VTANAGTRFTPACVDEHCITCGDQGLPLRVVTLEGSGLALCRDEAAPGEPDTIVDVQLVGDVAPGELVLVHAGVALVHLGGAVA
jgi:hydrogenase maturation factor